MFAVAIEVEAIVAVAKVEVPLASRVLVAMNDPVMERPIRVVDARDAEVVPRRTPTRV
jgi:aminoglycoside phosphotransferase (APT) family kinase protein